MNYDPKFEEHWNQMKPLVYEAWGNVDDVGNLKVG